MVEAGGAQAMRLVGIVTVFSWMLLTIVHVPAHAGPRYLLEPELWFFDKLTTGMTTPEEAERALGPPSTQELDGSLLVWTYHPTGPRVASILLAFRQGKLMEIHVELGRPLDEDTALELVGKPDEVWRQYDALAWRYWMSDGSLFTLFADRRSAGFDSIDVSRCSGPSCQPQRRGPF